MERLGVIADQLKPRRSVASTPAAAVPTPAAVATRLDGADLSLPLTTGVEYNYMDMERFASIHGPDARPCYGDLRAEDPAIEALNRSKLTFDFFTKREVATYDARAVADATRLDDHGICLRPWPTAMDPGQFYEKEMVDSVYLDECAAFIMAETGATAVLPFDSTIRNRDPASPAAGYAENRPHNDHTLTSGPRRTRELLGEDPVNDAVLDGYRCDSARILASFWTDFGLILHCILTSFWPRFDAGLRSSTFGEDGTAATIGRSHAARTITWTTRTTCRSKTWYIRTALVKPTRVKLPQRSTTSTSGSRRWLRMRRS